MAHFENFSDTNINSAYSHKDSGHSTPPSVAAEGSKIQLQVLRAQNPNIYKCPKSSNNSRKNSSANFYIDS